MWARHVCCNKKATNITYRNHCKYAGQAYLQWFETQILVKARPQRKELIAISLGVLQAHQRIWRAWQGLELATCKTQRNFNVWYIKRIVTLYLSQIREEVIHCESNVNNAVQPENQDIHNNISSSRSPFKLRCHVVLKIANTTWRYCILCVCRLVDHLPCSMVQGREITFSLVLVPRPQLMGTGSGNETEQYRTRSFSPFTHVEISLQHIKTSCTSNCCGLPASGKTVLVWHYVRIFSHYIIMSNRCA